MVTEVSNKGRVSAMNKKKKSTTYNYNIAPAAQQMHYSTQHYILQHIMGFSAYGTKPE